MTDKINKKLYGDTVSIDFYPESHRYKLSGSKSWLVSVTSATGVIDKSRVLIDWAMGLASTFLKQFFESSPINKFTAEELLPVIETALEQHTVKKEEAASIGTMVHEWAERFADSKLNGTEYPKLSEEMDEKVLAGITAFLEWYNTHDIKFVANEKMLYSKKYEYVGLTDAIAVIDGKKTVIDYKTAKRIYTEHLYQLSAYWAAYEEETGEKLDQALILHFNKETGELSERIISREEFESLFDIFLACLKIKKSEKELSKK